VRLLVEKEIAVKVAKAERDAKIAAKLKEDEFDVEAVRAKLKKMEAMGDALPPLPNTIDAMRRTEIEVEPMEDTNKSVIS
jgi:signal recognition particle GTPase